MLNRSIRKISVGSDVNNQLHISVNSKIGGNTVSTIKKVSSNVYEVWTMPEGSEDMSVWKTLENMPVIIEYNTRLD